jgi:serine/threonine-protein kinase
MVGLSIADRYLVEEKIGEGGLGSVYRASDRRVMGRKVVIKVLLDDWAEHGDVLRKFEHEKEALARLDHPAIVNILDAGTMDGGKSFFVMPFVEGRTLRQVIDERGRPDWNTCAHVIESITDALAAAHSKGILHRDIKPGNIMLSQLPGGKTRVLLIDFGIARVTGSETSPVTEVARPLGTVLYAAPEQLEGDPAQTPAADIYSCAIVAYELLTGHLPFRPTSIYHMVLLQHEGLKVLPSQLNSELSSSVDRIIARALSYDRTQRQQEATEFGDDLATELRRLSAITTLSGGESRITKPRQPIPDYVVPEPETSPSRASETTPEEMPVPVRVHVPVEPQASTVEEPDSTEKPPEPRSRLVPALALVGILLIAIVTGAGWLAYRFTAAEPAAPANLTKQPAAAPSTPAANRLQFQLLAKTEGQGPSQAPRPAGTGEVFTGDTGIAFDVRPAGDGYLYLYNEAEADPGKFNILFPTATQRGGNARVGAGEQVQTGFNVFEGPPGRDFIWLIWTRTPVTELEEIRARSVTTGTLDDPKLSKWLRDFLAAGSARNVEVSQDAALGTTLTTGQDQIVHRIEIAHR